ncbi:MAG TPA: hypothetical protein VF184_05930 [Phycisphaeraceae bacterium]
MVISIIALLISILLPALKAARKTAQEMVCSTRLRGYQQGLATFAQENNNWYPGVDSTGKILHRDEINIGGVMYAESHGSSNGARQALMLSRRYITPEYAISPADMNKTPWDPTSGAGIKTQNISFSMLAIAGVQNTNLHIGDPAANPNHIGRAREWRDTFNTRAIVMSDRPIVIPGGGNAALQEETGSTFSIHTQFTGSSNWRGHVVFNDNHVEYLPEQTAQTKYDDGPRVGNDNIFLFANEQISDLETGGVSAHAHEAGMVFLGHNRKTDTADPFLP